MPTPKLLLPQAMVDPTTLIPHPGNPRVHNDQLISESLAEFGLYQTPTINKRTGELVRGHGTVENYITTYPGKDIQVSVIDVSPETATRILLMDNRSSDTARNDDRLLAELLGGLPDLDYTGYEPGDLDSLLALLAAPTPTDEGNDQDVLDLTDRDTWPEIRAKVAPELHARWMDLPGADDAERVANALEQAGL